MNKKWFQFNFWIPFKKLFQFLCWKYEDTKNFLKNGREFNLYGLTIFCGRQGAGKTIAMTEYLERIRKRYPDALIITNYGYIHETKALESWEDFFNVRNGTKGVIFALDEIQNEWDNTKWKDFPESILREITQQRKQRVKIVGTSQVFSRVVKQLREQCFEVVECFTLLGRWTFTKAFDAEDYNAVIDSPEKKQKLHRLWRYSFIQHNSIRELYDTYLKIEKIQKAPNQLRRQIEKVS